MNVFSDVERECLVAAKTTVADGVVALDLVAANGRDLPPWEPGAHIDLILPGGVERPVLRLRRPLRSHALPRGDPARTARTRRHPIRA